MIHPFAWNEEIVALTIHNITHMLRGYLTCTWLDAVIFSYGFHGPRQQIWDTVLGNLQDITYAFVPVTLICEEATHVLRMTRDGRDPGRIERALATRPLYEALPYPRIDTTHLTVDEIAGQVMALVQRG